MCVNYTPLQRKILRDIFGVEPPPGEYPPETWPDYLAPIVRAADGHRDSVLANFQFIPKKRIPPGGRKIDTTNARSETVGQIKTFSGPWKSGQLCLIPMHSFFEPNYEAGPKSVRHQIWLKDEPAFAVAGLWRDWPDGLISFTMLTINADKHALMSRMHAPGTEKRSVVIVPRDGWDDWLTCRDPEAARTFLRLYPAQSMDSEPAPVPPRSAAFERSRPLF